MEGQDLISALLGALPPEWARILGNVLAVAIASRTLLLAIDKAGHELAVRFHGSTFGLWCGRVADVARAIDGVVETIFAVKGVLLRREGTQVLVRGVRRKAP